MIKPDRWIRDWGRERRRHALRGEPGQRRQLRRAGLRPLDLPHPRSRGVPRPAHQALPGRGRARLDPRVRAHPARRGLRPEAQVDPRPAVDQPLAGRLVRPRLRGQHHPRAAEPRPGSRSCSKPAGGSPSSSSSRWSPSRRSPTASRAPAATTRARGGRLRAREMRIAGCRRRDLQSAPRSRYSQRSIIGPVIMGIVGNLRTMQLEELLQWLSQSQKTGTLEINDGQGREEDLLPGRPDRRLGLHRPEEYLGHFLVSHGLINETDARQGDRAPGEPPACSSARSW